MTAATEKQRTGESFTRGIIRRGSIKQALARAKARKNKPEP